IAGRGRRGGIDATAVSKLTDGVVPPALHPAAGGERASVVPARTDRRHSTRKPEYIDRSEAIDLGVVSQLAVVCVLPPAFHSATGSERAGVRAACRNGRHPAGKSRDI